MPSFAKLIKLESDLSMDPSRACPATEGVSKGGMEWSRRAQDDRLLFCHSLSLSDFTRAANSEKRGQ